MSRQRYAPQFLRDLFVIPWRHCKNHARLLTGTQVYGPVLKIKLAHEGGWTGTFGNICRVIRSFQLFRNRLFTFNFSSFWKILADCVYCCCYFFALLYRNAVVNGLVKSSLTSSPYGDPTNDSALIPSKYKREGNGIVRKQEGRFPDSRNCWNNLFHFIFFFLRNFSVVIFFYLIWWSFLVFWMDGLSKESVFWGKGRKTCWVVFDTCRHGSSHRVRWMAPPHRYTYLEAFDLNAKETERIGDRSNLWYR